ncbi:hypothetical protein FocTR4_00011418, partial [Fusarium oxysporum f. sp. cubense]
QCAAFRVQDSLIVSNKEHQSSSEDATQNTFSRFANVEAQDFANFSVHLADSALLRFEDEALIASLRNETLHRCRYHSHNELPHEQFMCRQHIKLSDSPKILNLPNFSCPLTSVYTSYGSKLDRFMGCYKAVAQHDELYIYLDEKCHKVLDNRQLVTWALYGRKECCDSFMS